MACGRRALGPSGGCGVQEVDFQEMDTAQNINFSHPSPQRNNPLWHKQGDVGGRPGPEANQKEWGLQRVTDSSWLSPQTPAEGPGMLMHG